MTALVDLSGPVDPERDHLFGVPGAPLMIVEYGDYQCPFARRAYRYLQTLRRRYGDDLTVVFRHFPLRDKHPLAQCAAEAAEAAHAQGRFWDMHELLFRRQAALEPTQLREYAAKLSLDVQTFDSTLRDRSQAARIELDVDSGTESGVQGTPTLFLNGARWSGNYTRPLLAQAFERLLTAN